MEYVLALSLGPVQDFIAAARKTRDLWYGSQLLSDVAAAVAAKLRDDGARLVFPAPEVLSAAEPVNIPNKLLAVVPDTPGERAARAFEKAVARLQQAEQAARKLAEDRHIDRLIDWTLLAIQRASFLERFAAWYPYDAAQPEGYNEARHGAERLLAGRKALRDFGPASGRVGVPKSSLDPSRESVLRVRRSGAGGEEDGQTLARAAIKPGELLDGVSLIKRLAQPRRFVSVSRVALDPLLRRLAAEGAVSDLQQQAGVLSGRPGADVEGFSAVAFPQYASFPYDTQLFYDEEGSDRDGLRDPELERLQSEFHAQVRATLSRLKLGEPPAYLAILAADGDRMGRTLDSLSTEEAHRRFSAICVNFAGSAGQVVHAHQGALVYSGGDDVLAFLPLDRALGCAAALHEAFSATFGGLTGVASPPTLSVGLAIGHYSEPLSTLLQWAREAEHLAKTRRNALAVVMRTRSGGGVTSVLHGWEDDPAAQWTQWVAWFQGDLVPDGAAYELRGLARELRGPLAHGDRAAAALLLDAEVRRILSRKRGAHGDAALEAALIDTALEPLRGTNEDSAVSRLENLVSLMIIARHFARSATLATPQQEHAHA